MITIPTPNTDRTLLSLAEMRTAVGATDNSQDDHLIMLNNVISAMITNACFVIKDHAIPPTLRLETVVETFRPKHRVQALIPARFPIVEITSITENGSEIAPTDYEVSQGMIWRITSNCRGWWPAWGGWTNIFGGEVVATYSAGYEVVPYDLKYAATRFAQIEIRRGSRDPYLKARTVPGVLEQQWWVNPAQDSIIPTEVEDILERGGYINRTGSFA